MIAKMIISRNDGTIIVEAVGDITGGRHPLVWLSGIGGPIVENGLSYDGFKLEPTNVREHKPLFTKEEMRELLK